MATRYKMVKASSPVHKIAAKIVARFEEELGHVNLGDVQFAWRISNKSHYHGKTRIIRGEDCMFTDKKIIITLFLRSWKEHNVAWRSLFDIP